MAEVVKRARNLAVSTPFALGRLTPRHAQGSSDAVGFQASCFCSGHGACNKSLSASVVGGDIDNVQRMLKYWLVLGPSYTKKQSHKEAWEIVQSAFRAGELPSDTLLEACASSLQQHEDVSKRSCSSVAETLPSTPRDVHDACSRLMLEGVLPETTPAQRRRNRPRPGKWYSTPPDLTDAFRWGYTSPNLPNPQDCRWLLVDDDWQLLKKPRGG